jgi:hypothetical protein
MLVLVGRISCLSVEIKTKRFRWRSVTFYCSIFFEVYICLLLASPSFGFSLPDLKGVWTSLSSGWSTTAMQRLVFVSESSCPGRMVDQDVLPLKGFFKRTGYVDHVLVFESASVLSISPFPEAMDKPNLRQISSVGRTFPVFYGSNNLLAPGSHRELQTSGYAMSS